jgi:integrase
MNFDFNEISPVELENLYTSFIDDTSSPLQASYRAGRIRDLHEYCVGAFEFPVLESSILDEFSKEQASVRAGFINEQLFRVLCSSVQNLGDLDPITKDGLVCMLIICYRTGMRRAEALKLRLCDIENSMDRWTYVKPSIHGDDKSSNAVRKIPLEILLTKNESEFVGGYLRERRVDLGDKSKHLLFSMSHSTTVPHDSNQISLIVNNILRTLAHVDLTFHHLRHSAFCKLQAVFENDKTLIQLITPYSNQQASSIRQALVSLDDELMHRDTYYALAGIAGHATPATTFHNYLHFCDWVLGTRVAESSKIIKASDFKRLSGVSTHKISQACNELGLDPDGFELKDMVPLLINNLSASTITLGAGRSGDGLKSSEDFVAEIQPQRVVQIKQCYTILKDHEDGVPIEDLVFKFDAPEDKIQRFVESAKALRYLETSKGVPRLFSATRLESDKNLLTPSRPIWNSEKMEVDGAVNKLRKLYKEKESEIIWCLEYFLSKNNMSNTGLSFSNSQELSRFMDVFLQVFKASRWRIYYSVQLKDQNQHQSEKRWKSVSPYSKFITRKQAVKNETLFPCGKAELYLTHPDEPVITESRKAQPAEKISASNLRYLLHMMAIMILTKEQIMLLPSYRKSDQA